VEVTGPRPTRAGAELSPEERSWSWNELLFPLYVVLLALGWTVALAPWNAVLLPATVAACRGLVRGTAWAPRALYLVAGWLGLIGPAVRCDGDRDGGEP